MNSIGTFYIEIVKSMYICMDLILLVKRMNYNDL